MTRATRTTVDVDDTDDVVDVYADRLIDLSFEHGMQVHVLPPRPPEWIAAMRRQESSEILAAAG